MLSILISLLVLVLIFAIIFWVLSEIPIVPPFTWIVRVVVGILFLIAVIELLTGGYSLLPAAGHTLR